MEEEATTHLGGDLLETTEALRGMTQALEADKRVNEIRSRRIHLNLLADAITGFRGVLEEILETQHWMVKDRFARNNLYGMLDTLDDMSAVKRFLWDSIEN